jgi:hypothetical protein
MIAGVSTITAPGFFDTGEFEIWPEDDEDALRIGQIEAAALPMPHEPTRFRQLGTRRGTSVRMTS